MGKDGRIRTTFNQLATATGRLSSSNPNLQNIPVRGPLGRRMRACFTAPEGKSSFPPTIHKSSCACWPHMSQDETLLAAFREGTDIHARTASLLFDVPQSEITHDQRRNAKTINFGLIYGMGPQKLAQELKIPLSEAKAFMSRYFERLRGLKLFYEDAERQAREQGYVTTLAGRRRPLPDIEAENTQARSLARRQAINTLIQGSAADIIKLAMLRVRDRLSTEGMEGRLVLQVHDELIVECPEEEQGRVCALVEEEMERVISLSVPLLAETSAGKSWADAH